MQLPFADHARVEQSKICDYLLAFDHPEGAGKAEFFTRFGFTTIEWQIFANAMIAHAKVHAVSLTTQSKYGTKYRIDGPLSCPDGRTPLVRTVWIIDTGTDTPRLVTAYPL